MEKKSTVGDNADPPAVVPASVRADGSVRKERKIRPGFVPQELQQRYVPPARKRIQQTPKDIKADSQQPENNGASQSLAPRKKQPQTNDGQQSASPKYIPPHLRNKPGLLLAQNKCSTPPSVSGEREGECEPPAHKLHGLVRAIRNKDPVLGSGDESASHDSDLLQAPDSAAAENGPQNTESSSGIGPDALADAFNQIKLD
ncbi:hypothetical protein GGH99_001257 [Coemansia sp. RSA 1285]|nr:hypothetical protein GGH99_001257 [Coemansia sp. RSA 1285]